MRALALALVLLAPAAWSQDLLAGRRLAAQVCQGCHGMDGVARVAETPHLAGQDAIYLARQLRAYRERTRAHEQMAVVADGLTDEQIEAIAAYYAAIEFEVTRVPGRR